MTQNRKNRRSNVLMAARLELSGSAIDVKLRNLSAEGALIEGDDLPIEGSELMFRKGDLRVAGRVAWARGRQAGINFAQPLQPEQVLHHVPVPKPRVAPSFRRPGLAARQLSKEEIRYGEDWVFGKPIPPIGD